MELDEEADNMLVIEALDEDESVEEGVNKRAKTVHYQDAEYQRVQELYKQTIRQQVQQELLAFKERALATNKAVLQHIALRAKQQESQLREKYYYVPHVYAEQIRALQSSTALDLGTQQHIRATTLVPHPGIPKTTAHVTIRFNVAPRGFEARARPRYYAPYFEDGESEADPATIEKYYYAPPPHFRALCTELCVFRLLLALEDTRSAEEDEEDAQELISPVNLALASRVSNVPAAIIKHYFSTHTGLLTWKTQRARDLTSVMNGEEFYERFCRQCKLFECPLHMENNKWTPVHIARRTADLRDVPRNLTPCSDTCHLKVPLKEFSAHMPPEKVTLLKRGVVVLAKHYCRIRKCIAPSFTCAEIRDYAVAHLSTVHSLPKMAAPEPKEFNVQRKKKMSDKELAEYQPCSHEGPCSAKLCYCYAHNLHCEKYCACSADCSNRFKGCKCLGSCAGNCACARNRRECDLDVCKCDARTCAQRDLQTKKPKHLWIGASAVAGFGVFAVDRIKSGEFIGEYVGEVIPNNEAERRGLIADKIKRSYLFDTGSELCVDSTKFGNRLKFANHSATPNCAPKQLRVNGALRLAFYAVEDIEPNEELFINYDYADPSSKGITNERPVDVRANKGQLSLSTVLQSSSHATGQISAVHETDDSDSSSETSDEVPSVQAM